MPRYRVFLGAPSAREVREQLLADEQPTYRWETAQPTAPSSDLILSSDAYEEASRRITSNAIYQNNIFDESSNELEESYQLSQDVEEGGPAERTSFLDLPASFPAGSASQSNRDGTFLRPSLSGLVSRARSSLDSNLEDTQENSGSYNYTYSDSSSIAHLPTFHFNLRGLATLHALATAASAARSKGSRKVTLLVAVIEVDGPDTVTIKKGIDAGKEVSLLKMVLADDEGGAAKLVAWRETAEIWSGDGRAPSLARGDVVLLENVQAVWEPASAAISLTASPALASKATVCYRALPRTSADQRLRPDLRLGATEPSVRRVRALVDWFETMAGLRT